ncbi:Phage terminase, large subunit [plant metagenome]|uniref:Phage terminase, large subunit n=1 Tax=plant metagenome TaxID=1297885 RepID=A0A484QA33_9ZZZZ
MSPLSSTVRTVDWDELPPRVRQVPEGFNPLDEGVLMLHQREFVSIKASIKACPKGRRTGITFAVALDKTLVAAARKSAGGDNVFYIGDTKEKGLEFIGYCAKFARVIVQAQGEGVSSIEEFLFEDQDEKGNTRNINAFRIRFASGFQICALSSRPANIRGLQGHVVIDEAAFHPDVQGVLDAATALLIWGGQITVISSQNGKNNPFYQFCRDIEAGLYGSDAVVMTVTFDDAVANGLYERVCMMNGWVASAEKKAEWYLRIRKGYGARTAAMREELDAIPRDGNGVCLPSVWIEAAMPHERPVLRLTLNDDFARLPRDERDSYVKDWIVTNLDPVLVTLDKGLRWGVGRDYARHRDFSEVVPLGVTQTLRRVCPFALEMHKVPGRQQELIVWHILSALGNFTAAFDATGSGETEAENAADDFGASRVHQVKLSRAWYGAWMPKLLKLFEDGMIDIPRDDNLARDLRIIEEIDGIPMVPPLRTKDLKDADLLRHGDFAVALALAHFATLNYTFAFGWTAAPSHPRGYDNTRSTDAASMRDTDDDMTLPEQSAW